MIKIDAECREALHETLDAVIDTIEDGEIYTQFCLSNICLDVLVKLSKDDPDWAMFDSFYNTFSELDAKVVMDKLDRFSTTKQETSTTDEQ